MNASTTSKVDLSQSDKFKAAARDLETEDDPERFKERLVKLVKPKSTDKPKTK